jgi:hypothetical protein
MIKLLKIFQMLQSSKKYKEKKNRFWKMKSIFIFQNGQKKCPKWKSQNTSY